MKENIQKLACLQRAPTEQLHCDHGIQTIRLRGRRLSGSGFNYTSIRPVGTKEVVYRRSQLLDLLGEYHIFLRVCIYTDNLPLLLANQCTLVIILGKFMHGIYLNSGFWIVVIVCVAKFDTCLGNLL